MKTISVPIGRGRTDLCRLIRKVESGVHVIFTSHGKPKAVLTAFREQVKPWRVEKPDDPNRYGDLQSSVLTEWQ